MFGDPKVQIDQFLQSLTFFNNKEIVLMSAALRLMTQSSAQKLTMVTLFNSVYGLHDKYWQKHGGMVPTPKDPFTQVRTHLLCLGLG